MPAILDSLDDTLALRSMLTATGLSSVRYASVAGPANVRPALARIGYPAVLRTATRYPGWGPYLVGNPQHLNGWAALLERRGQSGPVLIDPHLRGDTYTIAVHSDGGVHTVLGIAEHHVSLPPLFISMGHVYPATLSPERTAAIGRAVDTLLTACGHHTGPVNIYLVWTVTGPEILRVRRAADRGDHFDRLAALAAPGRFAAQWHFWLPCGELDSIDGLEAIRALDHVHELVFPFRPGDRIPETLDARSRHGHVVLTGVSARQIRERVAGVRAMLKPAYRPRNGVGPAIPRPRAAS